MKQHIIVLLHAVTAIGAVNASSSVRGTAAAHGDRYLTAPQKLGLQSSGRNSARIDDVSKSSKDEDAELSPLRNGSMTIVLDEQNLDMKLLHHINRLNENEAATKSLLKGQTGRGLQKMGKKQDVHLQKPRQKQSNVNNNKPVATNVSSNTKPKKRWDTIEKEITQHVISPRNSNHYQRSRGSRSGRGNKPNNNKRNNNNGGRRPATNRKPAAKRKPNNNNNRNQGKKKQNANNKRPNNKKKQQGNNNNNKPGNLLRNCYPGQRPYRTCLSRTSSGFTHSTIVHNYQTPFTARNEELMSTDSMVLSLLQDSTNINCNTVQQIEEVTLSYLADNIGGRAFEPVCVQVLDDAYDRVEVPGTGRGGSSSSSNNGKNKKNGKQNKKNKQKRGIFHNRELQSKKEYVESTTLRLRVSYVQKVGPGVSRRLLEEQGFQGEFVGHLLEHEPSNGELFEEGISNPHEPEQVDFTTTIANNQRELQWSRCTPIEKAECCSQNAINNDVGQYCKSLGCNYQKCGSGRTRPRRRPPRRVEQEEAEAKEDEADAETRKRRRLHVPPFTLKNVDFNSAVRKHTQFKPDQSEAQLDVDDIESVATCSANRYSVEEVCSFAAVCHAVMFTLVATRLYMKLTPCCSINIVLLLSVWRTHIGMQPIYQGIFM